jgi:polyphosphate glucokinase
MRMLGIDIGGTGIKGAVVDVTKGELVTERHRLLTPQPSKPKAVASVVAEIVQHFQWQGPVGCAFPAVVRQGVVCTAANVDKEWIGVDGQKALQDTLGLPVLLLNDADAAGIAEMRFGAGRTEPGLVLMITLGTGVGSALFWHGQLIPNSELGHLEIRGKDSELRVSDHARQAKGLSWKKWAKRLDEYFDTLEALLSPDLFIVGGGVSKEHERFLPRLTTRVRAVPAQFFNEAGIVGAALAAADVYGDSQGEPSSSEPLVVKSET